MAKPVRTKRVPEADYRRVCNERDMLIKVLSDVTAGLQPVCTRVWRDDGDRVSWRLFRVLGADGGLVFETRTTKTSRVCSVETLDRVAIHYQITTAAAQAIADLRSARERAYEQDRQAHKLVKGA